MKISKLSEGYEATETAYAGVGSRETPEHVGEEMIRIASYLADIGWTLRTGGAVGADSFFEQGARDAGGHVELYLPWEGFRGKTGYSHITRQAYQTVDKYHPAPHKLTPSATKLMGRNAYQVLGKCLDNPVKFVVCWTPKGSGSGGTGQRESNR